MVNNVNKVKRSKYPKDKVIGRRYMLWALYLSLMAILVYFRANETDIFSKSKESKEFPLNVHKQEPRIRAIDVFKSHIYALDSANGVVLVFDQDLRLLRSIESECMLSDDYSQDLRVLSDGTILIFRPIHREVCVFSNGFSGGTFLGKKVIYLPRKNFTQFEVDSNGILYLLELEWDSLTIKIVSTKDGIEYQDIFEDRLGAGQGDPLEWVQDKNGNFYIAKTTWGDGKPVGQKIIVVGMDGIKKIWNEVKMKRARLAVDNGGYVYIASSEGRAIRKYEISGKFRVEYSKAVKEFIGEGEILDVAVAGNDLIILHRDFLRTRLARFFPRDSTVKVSMEWQ